MKSVAGVRDALLVAAGTYDNSHLSQLRSPARDAHELASVLEDQAIGGFSVTQVIDKPHYEVASAIERFFQDRSPGDLLLLHLSCHGIKDIDGALYFASVNTDPTLPASHGNSVRLPSQPDAAIARQVHRATARLLL